MRFQKFFLSLIFLSISTTFTYAQTKHFKYREQTGDITKYFTRDLIVEKGKIQMNYLEPGGVDSRVLAGQDYYSKKWMIKDPKVGLDMVFELVGDKIKAEGLFSGKVISKNYNVDDGQWMQIMEFGLSPTLNDYKKPVTFWVIRPTDMEMFNFVATKSGEEKVDVIDKQVDAIKVKVTINDWRSMFWSSFYWFRKSDGVLVRYEAVRGGPGTPLTVIELVE